MVVPVWVTTMDVRSAYWQFSVSSQHVVKSLTLNPYMSLFNLKLCIHICTTNINFRHPLHWTFWVRLGLNFHPMGEFGGRGRGGSIGPPTLFVTDRNVTKVAPRSMHEVRLKTLSQRENTCYGTDYWAQLSTTNLLQMLSYIRNVTMAKFLWPCSIIVHSQSSTHTCLRGLVV